MTDEPFLQTLRDVAFLRGIDDADLAKIAAIAQAIEYSQGKVIFREGEPANNFYLITQGSVSLEICAPGAGCRRIFTVTDGELLGWSPILEQTRLTALARTLTPTRVVEINAGQMLTLCEHNPRFGYEFMRRAALALARRLSATRLQLLDVYGSELPKTPNADEDLA